MPGTTLEPGGMGTQLELEQVPRGKVAARAGLLLRNLELFLNYFLLNFDIFQTAWHGWYFRVLTSR